ncbi:MAG: 6,7-dimethyl-8-ribityllumazine synthase [Chloroflexi bacterium]|nr:6,7-dimethyl-8-ribityllumazine synthase [Chloroflexota bacterium]
MKQLSGHPDGRGLRIAIAVARFNEYVTRRLLESAVSTLKKQGVRDADITVAWVPGSFELPGVAARLAETDGVDAVICLGCVIKGETAHFEYVAGGASEGLARVAIEIGKPVIFGVLTTYTTDQAIKRADESGLDLGADFARAAIEMANLHRTIGDRA